MSVADAPTRLPFNGTLSEDEMRMASQGYGERGIDYPVEPGAPG